MNYSGEDSQKIPGKTSKNKNTTNPKKSKFFKFNKRKSGYLHRSNTNVSWVYNTDPLKKIVAVAVSLILLIGGAYILNQESRRKELKQAERARSKNQHSSEKDNELIALQSILKDVKENKSKPSQDVYVWNENGKVHASNTNHPTDNTPVRKIENIATASTETKFTKEGNSILIPVVISHNGQAIQINMMLDTGCSTTMIDAEVTNALNLQPDGAIETIIADGSKLTSRKGTVDFFQVGPFKESKFPIITNPVMGTNKKQHGLLGMNFLEKHPFTIDSRRQVVLWR